MDKWNKFYHDKYDFLPNKTASEKREAHDAAVFYAREQMKKLNKR